MKAAPAAFGDVPEEVYPLIVQHAPLATLTRLSLASKQWAAAVGGHAVTEPFWRRLLEPKPDFEPYCWSARDAIHEPQDFNRLVRPRRLERNGG